MQGYIKDYRKELDSDIWLMPPLYHRVWQYLKYKVNHQPKRIPIDNGFLTIKPGQHLTSIRNIAKDVGWYERASWKEPNPKTVKKVLEWLEKQEMISIDRGKGNRQYTLITLINWYSYQSNDEEGNSGDTQQNDENAVYGNSTETEETPIHQGYSNRNSVSSNSEETVGKQDMDINKNEKNDKELVVVDNEQLNKNPVDPSQKDDLDIIADRYADLKSAQEEKLVYPSHDDYQAIARIVAQGVPTSQTIKLLEECFADFERRNQETGNTIKSFRYCEKFIESNYKSLIAREKARKEAIANGQAWGSARKTSSQDGRNETKRSITGGQVGWIKSRRA